MKVFNVASTVTCLPRVPCRVIPRGWTPTGQSTVCRVINLARGRDRDIGANKSTDLPEPNAPGAVTKDDQVSLASTCGN